MKSTTATAALAVLIILQLVMLFSLFAGVPPHPPEAIPLFGMAPFVGVSIALATAAMMLGPTGSRFGVTVSLLAALSALVSFGPQKYLDPQFQLVWPAVLVAQIAVVFLVTDLIRTRRRASA